MSRGYMCHSKSLLTFSLTLFWLIAASSVYATVTPTRGSIVRNLYRHQPLTAYDPKRKTVGIVTVPISKKLAGRIAEEFTSCKECKAKYKDLLENSKKMTFFPMSYAKWISQQQVNIVPIDVNMPIKAVRKTFARLNGILLPGGSTPVYDTKFERILVDIGVTSIKKRSRYTQRMKRLIQSVIAYNRRNIYKKISVWGTCLGMEELILTEVHENFVFADVVNKDENRKIEFIDDQSEIKKAFSQTGNPLIFEARFYYNHKYALYVSDFNKNDSLTANYRVVAQSYTKEPQPYKPIVAMIEHLTEPIYGVQFHPEKNKFESNLETDHSQATVDAVDALARFFVKKLSVQPKFNGEKYWRTLFKEYTGFFVQNISHYDEIAVFMNNKDI